MGVERAVAAQDQAENPDRAFAYWRHASLALRAAEIRGEPYVALLRRSEEVILARGVLLRERVQAGLRVPNSVMSHQSLDEFLLRQPDDRLS